MSLRVSDSGQSKSLLARSLTLVGREIGSKQTVCYKLFRLERHMSAATAVERSQVFLKTCSKDDEPAS